MTVYVDDYRAAYRRMKMSHLLADTTEELLAMIDRIGVSRRWIQNAGTPQEHFDVCEAKRALAVKAGAVEVAYRDLGRMLRNRRSIGRLT